MGVDGGGGVGGAASPAGAAGNRPAGCEAIEEAPPRLTPHHRQAPVLQQIRAESERPSAGQGARASAAGQSPSKGVTFAPPTTGKR